MGLIDIPFPTVGSDSFASLTRDDFKEGLKLEEKIPGSIGLLAILVGRMIPFTPFERSGTLETSQEYYPGSDEPVIHVLGAREDVITLRGNLKDKNFASLLNPHEFLSEGIMEILDDMRKRGHIIKMTLGEFQRYGLITRFTHTMKDRHDFKYEFDFTFVSHDEPSKCAIIEDNFSFPSEFNQDLLLLASTLASLQSSIPLSIPVSISFLLNRIIGEIAAAVAAVTGFIDDVVAEGEGITGSLNRAVGVARVAKTSIMKNIIKLGKIAHDLHFAADSAGSITDPIVNPFQKPPANISASYKGADFIQNNQQVAFDAMAFISQIQDRLEKLNITIPQARHLVKQGDTLQKLAIKFYKDADQWEKIYDHNKLTTLVLNPATVLEIPKIK